MANRKRNKVRRITPRSRNAPKPFDDGMQHFMVSVPRQANPIVDQAVRDQVADTIDAAAHPQRFTGIEEAPKPSLMPDPVKLAESMKRISEAEAADQDAKLAAGQPAPVAADTSDLQAAMKKVVAGEPLDEPPPNPITKAPQEPTPDQPQWVSPTDEQIKTTISRVMDVVIANQPQPPKPPGIIEIAGEQLAKGIIFGAGLFWGVVASGYGLWKAWPWLEGLDLWRQL